MMQNFLWYFTTYIGISTVIKTKYCYFVKIIILYANVAGLLTKVQENLFILFSVKQESMMLTLKNKQKMIVTKGQKS